MNGLFDAISGRFGPDTVPAITPRSRLRFEHEPQEDVGFEEQAIDVIAQQPQPRSPTAPRQRAMPWTHPAEHAVTPATPEPDQHAMPNRETPREQVRHIPEQAQPLPHSTPQEARPSATNTDPAQPDTQTRRETLSPPTDRTPQNPPETTRQQKVTEHLTGQSVELVTRTAAPEPPAAAAPAPAPWSSRDTRNDAGSTPEPPAPQVTVKIGRISVSKPAPPPAPPRPASPSPTSRSPARSQKSNLTTYLGWKT